MLRIYCDKNIFSLIKEGKPFYKPELKKTMDDLKDKMMFVYSYAHHQDLSNSKREYWDEDLSILETYTKDHYFDYDAIKKFTDFYLVSPHQSFYDIDFEASKNAMNDSENFIKDTFSSLDDEVGEIFGNIFNQVLKMPIPDFPSENIKDEKEQEWANKFFPSVKNSTLGDFINQMYSYGSRLLNDRNEVKEIKKMMEEYVSSDKYSFEKWKDDFNEKFKDSFEGKSFTDLMEQVFASVGHYNDYDKFGMFYNSLELYNVTKDKRLRDTQNLNSINTDSNHAWFASFTDYLVTNDKGMAAKAYIAYKYFGINTKILLTEEFVNHRLALINQEELSIKKFLETLEYEKDHSLALRKLESSNSVILKPQHKFFNYFNRISVSNEKITLYCQRHPNANFVVYPEIELLVRKLIDLLGVDSYNKGYYNLEKEMDSEDVYIREWYYNDISFKFGEGYNNGGQCLLLDIFQQRK